MTNPYWPNRPAPPADNDLGSTDRVPEPLDIDWTSLSPRKVAQLHIEVCGRVNTAHTSLLREAIYRAGGQRALCREIGYCVNNLSAALCGRRPVGMALMHRVLWYLDSQATSPQKA